MELSKTNLWADLSDEQSETINGGTYYCPPKYKPVCYYPPKKECYKPVKKECYKPVKKHYC